MGVLCLENFHFKWMQDFFVHFLLYRFLSFLIYFKDKSKLDYFVLFHRLAYKITFWFQNLKNVRRKKVYGNLIFKAWGQNWIGTGIFFVSLLHKSFLKTEKCVQLKRKRKKQPRDNYFDNTIKRRLKNFLWLTRKLFYETKCSEA